MTTPHAGIPAARALPPRPNLEYLKNEAKRRLDAARPANPRLKLTDVQFQLAREYGFASWRELKARLEQRGDGPDPVGDWVALERMFAVALHIRRTDLGGLRATLDVPSQGYFDDPVEALTIAGDRLSFTITVRGINALYEAVWDASAQRWAGTWTQTGLESPLAFTRGTLPPAPVLEGLDGLWDGHLKAPEPVRVTFRIRTDEHGTLAWLESSRTEGTWFAAAAIGREGDDVTIKLHTRSVHGRLSADGQRIEGEWKRGDKTVPLVLTRRAPGAPAPRVSIPEAIDLSPEALAEFVGAYAPEAGPPMTLGIDNGRLWVLTTAGKPGFELIPTGPNAFYTRQADATVTFERGPDGQVATLVLRMRGREARHRRLL